MSINERMCGFRFLIKTTTNYIMQLCETNALNGNVP